MARFKSQSDRNRGENDYLLLSFLILYVLLTKTRPKMLKHSSPNLQCAVLNLFYLMLNTGRFPMIWNKAIITTIFKSGDKLDLSDYGGICVNSNLGILCSVINSRFSTWLIEHNVLSTSPICFLPQHQITCVLYTHLLKITFPV